MLPPLPSSQSFSDLLDMTLSQSSWYSEPSRANPPSIAVDATASKSRLSPVLGSSQAGNPAASTPDPQVSVNPEASGKCSIGSTYHNRVYSLSNRGYASPDYSPSIRGYASPDYSLSDRGYAGPDYSLSDGGYTTPAIYRRPVVLKSLARDASTSCLWVKRNSEASGKYCLANVNNHQD